MKRGIITGDSEDEMKLQTCHFGRLLNWLAPAKYMCMSKLVQFILLYSWLDEQRYVLEEERRRMTRVVD